MSGFAVGSKEDPIVLDQFALRQFKDPKSASSSSAVSSSASLAYSPIELTKRVNDYHKQNGHKLVDGYAPFCKHLFVPCFIDDLKCSYATLSADNLQHLKSDYIARSSAELPVLTRWLDKEHVQGDPATHLDIILYSREQIKKENAEMAQHTKADEAAKENEQFSQQYDSENVHETGKWEWGIISIKPQVGDKELPMLPITVMRNSLISEGGSGVDIDRTKYNEAVEFWKKHANIS